MAEEIETGMLRPTLHRTTGKCNSTNNHPLSCFDRRPSSGAERYVEVGWIWPYVFGTLVLAEANVWMFDEFFPHVLLVS